MWWTTGGGGYGCGSDVGEGVSLVGGVGVGCSLSGGDGVCGSDYGSGGGVCGGVGDILVLFGNM